jgi:hypothetical protein
MEHVSRCEILPTSFPIQYQLLTAELRIQTIKNAVLTSQETYYVSVTKPKRLILCGETVATYRDNHTEHTDTVLTSQKTHYVSYTKPNRLMLFGQQSLFIVRIIRNTHIRTYIRLRYRDQPVNAVWVSSRSLF